MKLIGMLDSPYVRRVAISLQCLGLRFEHEALSVFRTFDRFQRINPVVKAPTLICDDGEVLMDSTLIIEYAQEIAHPRKLMPSGLAEFQHAQRVVGLALAACEKSVQIVLECDLRPEEKCHQPWVERVQGQLLAAYAALEQEVARRPPVVTSAAITQDTISTAVAWQFAQQLLPGVVPLDSHPALAVLSAQAEALPEFQAAPHGDGRIEVPINPAFEDVGLVSTPCSSPKGEVRRGMGYSGSDQSHNHSDSLLGKEGTAEPYSTNGCRASKWSDWLPFPDPGEKGYLQAPFGPGVYELRRVDEREQEKVLRGHGKNCAFRMSSLLPAPKGQGTRNNKSKRDYVADNLKDIEYRTLACQTVEDAKVMEKQLNKDEPCLFPT